MAASRRARSRSHGYRGGDGRPITRGREGSLAHPWKPRGRCTRRDRVPRDRAWIIRLRCRRKKRAVGGEEEEATEEEDNDGNGDVHEDESRREPPTTRRCRARRSRRRAATCGDHVGKTRTGSLYRRETPLRVSERASVRMCTYVCVCVCVLAMKRASERT